MIEVTEGGNTQFLIFLHQAHGWHSNGTADFVLRLSKLKTEHFFLKIYIQFLYQEFGG